MQMSRNDYVGHYGPTVGDRIRLADTSLLIEIEADLIRHGEEAKFGGGKTIRDAMGQNPSITRMAGSPDLVITNAVILDSSGIIKADIAVRDGRIAAIGHAGNSIASAGVNIEIGAGTEVISGEGMIVTAGGVDCHVHFIAADQVVAAISSGVTTMIGGGTGPATGTKATTCTPGSWNLNQMINAFENMPVNVGFMGKGNSSSPEALQEQIQGGAMGLKLHEDWGSTPTAIDTCLSVADLYDIPVAIHTDTLNESGFVERTIEAVAGRAIHAFHTEGAGGGHAPDILKVAGIPNFIPSSTNPTRPFTINTVEEHLDMLMVCHHLSRSVAEDVAFADSRIRRETIAAEDVFHDIGAISIISSDSQAMGRVGEVIIRTWQTADKMKLERGPLPEDSERNDNFRAKRYVAKYTINPALANGIAEHVGSVTVGKLADLVLWNPAFFGVRPDLVLKSGLIAYAAVGDPNASIPTPQPVFLKPQFASLGTASSALSKTFVSGVYFETSDSASWSHRERIPVSGTRTIGKADMVNNATLGKIEVDPQSYEVRFNGELVQSSPAERLSMAQRYFLF